MSPEEAALEPGPEQLAGISHQQQLKLARAFWLVGTGLVLPALNVGLRGGFSRWGTLPDPQPSDLILSALFWLGALALTGGPALCLWGLARLRRLNRSYLAAMPAAVALLALSVLQVAGVLPRYDFWDDIRPRWFALAAMTFRTTAILTFVWLLCKGTAQVARGLGVERVPRRAYWAAGFLTSAIGGLLLFRVVLLVVAGFAPQRALPGLAGPLAIVVAVVVFVLAIAAMVAAIALALAGALLLLDTLYQAYRAVRSAEPDRLRPLLRTA